MKTKNPIILLILIFLMFFSVENPRVWAVDESDVSDIRKEIEWLRNELKDMKKDKVEVEKDAKHEGILEFRIKMGETGGEGSYRLKTSYLRDLNADSGFIISLDTMDGKVSSSLRNFATMLIDVEGFISTDLGFDKPVLLKATFGPGDILHRDSSGVFPSEDYRVYKRPYPSIGIEMDLGGFDASASYISRIVQNSGTVSTSEVALELTKDMGELWGMGNIEWLGKMRVIFVDILDPTAYDIDSFAGMGFKLSQNENTYEEIFLDFGSSLSNMQFVSVKCAAKKFRGGPTDIVFTFHSVGSSYRKGFISGLFMPVNLFDKYLMNGSIDIGLSINHRISNRLSLNLKTDAVLDRDGRNDASTVGTSFISELGLDYYLSKDLLLSGKVRNYNVPSGVGQYSNALPISSDEFIFSLTHIF